MGVTPPVLGAAVPVVVVQLCVFPLVVQTVVVVVPLGAVVTVVVTPLLVVVVTVVVLAGAETPGGICA
jgi:hypothetical protein